MQVIIFRVLRGIGCFCLLALTGCATISGGKQLVYVDSEPPGAEVRLSGENLGQTPGLVRLPYEKELELKVLYGSQERDLKLQTRYRWDSFWSNFVFLSYAPIGWLVDILSGRAYKAEDPETAKFKLTGRVASPRVEPPRIAIAPPIASTVRGSDEAARFWEEKLKSLYPSANIVAYQKSFPLFQHAGFENDSSISDLEARRKILHELDATLIFVSTVTDHAQGVDVKGEGLDAKGRSVLKTAEFAMQGIRRSEEGATERSWVSRNYQWIKVIPNTFSLESSNSNVALDTTGVNGDQTYPSERVLDRSPYAMALSSLESLSLSRIRTPRLDRDLRWFIQLTPGVKLSYQRFFFPTFAELASVEFRYFRLGAGIGPEMVWQWGRNSLYMNLIPLLSYYWVEWEQPGGGREQRIATPIDFQFEVGYLYFFNESLSMRLYSKSVGARSELWNDVAHRINPTAPEITYPREIVTGFALGYTFDVERLIRR